MPLLNIYVVTSNCKTVQVALCFLSGKKDLDYDWAIEKFGDVITNNKIPEPDIWVTNRELALINTLNYLFPKGDHLLCT